MSQMGNIGAKRTRFNAKVVLFPDKANTLNKHYRITSASQPKQFLEKAF